MITQQIRLDNYRALIKAVLDHPYVTSYAKGYVEVIAERIESHPNEVMDFNRHVTLSEEVGYPDIVVDVDFKKAKCISCGKSFLPLEPDDACCSQKCADIDLIITCMLPQPGV